MSERECAETKRELFDRDTCHDYVVAHGCGAPTEEGYVVAEQLYRNGSEYADIAFEVVFREHTEEIEGDES